MRRGWVSVGLLSPGLLQGSAANLGESSKSRTKMSLGGLETPRLPIYQVQVKMKKRNYRKLFNKRNKFQKGIMVQACNFSTRETQAGGFELRPVSLHSDPELR